MKFGTDELVIWNHPCNMIMNGDVIYGDLTITNKKILFRAMGGKTFLSRSNKMTDFWELELDKINDIGPFEMADYEHPMIRIRYRENEIFLRFGDFEQRPITTALIVFVNHAKLIERVMSVMRSLDGSLKNGNLHVGDKLPHIMVDITKKVDEDCFQCGKPLIEEEMELLSQQVKECIRCIPENTS